METSVYIAALVYLPDSPNLLSVSIETCDSLILGWIHTSALWIYSSVFSIEEKDTTTGEISQHCTLLSKQGQRREKTSAGKGGGPRPPGLSPTRRIYLNFHGLTWVLQGHLSPHVFPSFTPKNSMQGKRFPVAAAWLICTS